MLQNWFVEYEDILLMKMLCVAFWLGGFHYQLSSLSLVWSSEGFFVKSSSPSGDI